MGLITLSDFSGGLNKRSAERLAPNEASELTNLLHVEGNLQVWPGKTQHASGDIGTGTEAVTELCRFYKDGTGYTLAVTGNYIYIDTGAQIQPWRPIIGGAMGGSTARMSLTPFGGRVYIGCDPVVRPRRYDAFYYITGTASCAGGATVTGTGANWSTGGVRAGDSIFFYFNSTWSGNSVAYTVRSIDSATQVTLDGNGPNTGGAVPYIIVRVHNMGIEQPTDAITVTAAAGAGLSVGAYEYKYTHYNSQTATESNANATAVSVNTTSANSQVTVGSIGTPTDTQIDQLKIYRTKVGGSIFYLLATLNRDQAGYTFATSYTDSTADSALGAVLKTDHEPPPLGLHFFGWNNRLYGFGSEVNAYTGGANYSSIDHRNQLWFSTLNSPEYWPSNNFGLTEPQFDDNTVGGYVTVGDSGSAITSLVGEGGTASGLDRTGSNLLIFKAAGLAYRWYGYTWTDFELHEAFAADCLSDNAKTEGGMVFWVGKKGPMALVAQTNSPIPIYEKLFPIESNPFITVVQLNSSYQRDREIATAVWRDYFIAAYPASGADYNNRVFAYHIPTNTAFEIGDSATVLSLACFSVWNGPGDSEELYAGDSNDNRIWRLWNKTSANTYWTGTTGVNWAYKTPIVTGDKKETFRRKHVSEVRLYFQKPSAIQNVSAKLIKNGGTDGTVKSLSIGTAGNDERKIVKWHPAEHGWGFQVRVTGTTTVPVKLEGIEIDYTAEGKQP